MPAQPPLLEISNVSVKRGERLVLDRLSLSIEAGEHVAILGPNGCGKSTLIKTITRECYPLLDPAASFRILGHDSWNIFDLRTHIGVVSNDLMTSCTRDITGRELVLSGFFGSIGIWPNHHVTPEMERIAATVMAQLDSTHLAARWLDELSSGEARRLLIARALIHNPQTLLLDEPTTSLDLAGLHELRGHLRALAQQGVGIVLVTHHLDDIVPEIDRVILLRDGRVYREGPKRQILSADVLSDTFRVQVEVVVRDGFYHAW
jgi:iron complex transport system ATP-binding protein